MDPEKAGRTSVNSTGGPDMHRRFRMAGKVPTMAPALLLNWAIAVPAGAQLATPGLGAELADAPGRDIYAASCANCHGLDGTGLDRSLVAFEEELPDFTDCDFAAREPDADWIAVAHEGGPIRGFSEMMPAFRGALTEEQLARVMSYIRTLCTDANWPRGELNLPRPLLTEKAYPEDEWVVEGDGDIEGGDAITSAFVYEYRFGPRSQVEVVIPYGWRRGAAGSDVHHHAGGSDHDRYRHVGRGDDDRDHSDEDRTRGERWSHGLGDVVVGLKHALFHSIESGTIFSLGGEVILPTGEAGAGLGAPGSALEPFMSFGQILPRDAFLQGQAGVEVPLYEDGETEGFGRLVLGATRTEGAWGRAWSPMLEVQARRGFGSGAETLVDFVPQLQVSLNTRQHVLANVGVLVPVGETSGAERPIRLIAYVLLDWFDGGFFEGW